MRTKFLFPSIAVAAAVLSTGCQPAQSPATGSGSTVSQTGSSLPVPKLVLDESVTPSIDEGNLTVASAINRNEVQSFLGRTLKPAEASYLEKNKFVLLPLQETNIMPPADRFNYDSMLNSFDAIQGSYADWLRKPENAKFVTPDIVLHGYHKYFEMTLEELEKHDLRNALTSFLDDMVAGALAATKSGDAVTKERAQSVAAQMITAQILLQNAQTQRPDYFPTPDDETNWTKNDETADSFDNAAKLIPKYATSLSAEMRQKISDELALVYEANTVKESPLYNQYKEDVKADYTQYTPRSHYTKSSAQRAYFRAMMFLGRNGYVLSKDIGLRDATLATSLLDAKQADGSTPRQYWNTIMDITGFYAGQSDDLTVNEWQVYVKDVLRQDLSKQLSDANLQSLGSNLDKLRLPKILSDVVVNPDVLVKTKEDLLRDSLSVRVFGQRFTFDAWVLNQLTAGDEVSEPKLPSTPSALFVDAALGGARAEMHIPRFLKDSAQFTDDETTGFLQKLSDIRASLANVTPMDWFSSLGTAWTHVLASLTGSFGKGYPLYMQSDAFGDKQIQSFLGSYAELKHDTLLYAKQSYAELGAGGPDPQTPPPVPKGFVEPNLVFWNRLLQLVAKQSDLFTRYHLLENTNAAMRLEQFNTDIMFYGTLAQKELSGTQISDDEYETLRTKNIAYLADPFDGGQQPDEDSAKTELIADIHTDAKKGQILYEATARPYVMLALVGNEKSPRLVIGLAYNHYELTAPLGGNRLTDEDWKNTVYDRPETLPAKNFWYDSLVAK